MSGRSVARTALLLSPHLDDVAFSCGGLAAGLAQSGWRVVIATAFTRSVHPATGFALACQRDKQLPDDVDYLALRRDEDRAACAALGAEQRLLDLPEAPNRGYASAAALFAPPQAEDDIVPELARRLAPLMLETAPALLLAPQGCGNHVDHLRLIEAVLALRSSGVPDAARLGFYRDTPYVIRDRQAPPDHRVASVAHQDVALPMGEPALSAKLQAVTAYASQLGFQFGGAAEARASITSLAQREAAGPGQAERFLTADADALTALIGSSLSYVKAADSRFRLTQPETIRR